MYNLTNYKALLKLLLREGYSEKLFTESFSSEKHLFLRHDIDICLEKAVQMATCENEVGVRATYFVLLDTDFYNIFSSQCRKILSEIQLLGHKIGLHFDRTSLNSAHDIEARVAQECSILEDVIQDPVHVVAPHRPSQSFLGNPKKICGRVHPYQPRFFSDIQYVSDSLGGWTRDHPTNCAAFRSKKTMQILTHPYIWTTPTARSQLERIREVLLQKATVMELAAQKNFNTYRPNAKVQDAVHQTCELSD